MFEPTAQQLNAISAKGSVLVTAAAGSGKTAVLVERVAKMICDRENPISVDRLLIVTFTNAAAAEMRQRIERRLYEEQKKNPDDRRIARQMLLLPSAQICTIDSFCINLVRDNFADLGISPDFKISETNALRPLYSDAAEIVLSNWYKTRTDEITALISALGSEYGDSRLVDTVKHVFNYSRTMPYPDDWLRHCADLYEDDSSIWTDTVSDSAMQQLLSAKSQLCNALKEIENDDALKQKYGETLTKAYDDFEIIINAVKGKSGNADMLCSDFDFPILRGFYNNNTAATVRRARTAAIDAVKSCLSCGLDGEQTKAELRAVSPLCRTLIEITLEFSKCLSELMAEKNILTFFNTEQLALELLTEKNGTEYAESERAAALSAGFDEVLVDEYQDVNDLQDRLFRLLSDGGKKLFAVGDVKQSIYGFRGANPDNFVQKQEKCVSFADAGEDDNKRIVLSSNFRSRNGICKFVNYFFSLIMSKNLGGVDYNEDEQLNAASKFPQNDMIDTEIHIVTADEESDSAAVAEARHIAEYVKSTVAGEAFLRDGDGLRKAQYSDFAILLRSVKGNAGTYIEEFKKAGIPVSCDSGGFMESREVSIAMSILRVINNPTHDVPLLSLLMSPVFAFTADEVASIRLANRKGNLYSAVVLSAQSGNAHAQYFLDTIKKYRTMAVTMTVDKLLSRLYDETGLPDIVLSMDDGEKRRNNLLILQSRAAQFSSENRGVGRFIAYMEKVGDGLTCAGDCGSGNAVRIMSIHASKGLQFPICIMAGCYKKFNNQDTRESLVLDRRLGIAFKVDDRKNNRRIETVARKAIVANMKRDSLSEELRLIYVAMTRAEERLVVILTDSNPMKKLCDISKRINDGDEQDLITGANRCFDWFIYAALKAKSCEFLRKLSAVEIPENKLENAGEIRIVYGGEQAENEPAEETAQGFSADGDTVAEIKNRFAFVYPYSSLLSVAAKASVSDIVHGGQVGQNGFRAHPAFLSDSGFTPAQRGTLTHKFMQYADYDASERNIGTEIDRLVGEEFLTRAEADAIDRAALERFFKGSVYKLIKSANEIYREMRFITELPVTELYPEADAADERVVVQGIIDCVIESDDGLTVLDFKTDRVKSVSSLADMYSRQLEIYAQACEKIFSKPVKRKIIYSFALDDIAEV